MFEAQVSNVVKRQLHEYVHSFKIVMHYFRNVLRGSLPFVMARTDASKLQQDAALDHEAIKYLQMLVGTLDQRSEWFECFDAPTDLTESFGQPLDEVSPSDAEAPEGRWVQELFRALDR